MPVVDGRTDGWTHGCADRTEFLGPLLALPGVQKMKNTKYNMPINDEDVNLCRPCFEKGKYT